MLLVLMGLPGSGKTSLAKLVAEKHGFLVYDMDSTLPKSMKETMKNGGLITPEEREAYQNMWMEDLKNAVRDRSVIAALVLPKERQRRLLLDAFPEAIIFNIRAPLEILKQRLRNRKDHFFTEQTLEKAFASTEDINVKHTDLDGTKALDDLARTIEQMIYG